MTARRLCAVQPAILAEALELGNTFRRSSAPDGRAPLYAGITRRVLRTRPTTPEEIVALAAAVEARSSHPLARAVTAYAAELGVDERHAGLLPDQKHALIASLRTQYGPVLMVGDGINDAPALAAADVGVAMGAAGSDVALETADVALMSDELLKLPYAIRLARATLWNVRTNVAISLALKAAFLVMALNGSATLWMAVLADTGASVIVVGNALRLLRTR